jgi:hypothetical protein
VTLRASRLRCRSAHVQGNCSAAPPAVGSPPLLTLKPFQCVLTTDLGVFQTDVVDGPDALLLKNVYLRATTDVSDGTLVTARTLGGSLWLEDVTFQGNYANSTGGFWHAFSTDSGSATLPIPGIKMQVYAGGASLSFLHMCQCRSGTALYNRLC